MIHKKILIAVFAAFSLGACGGGGGDTLVDDDPAGDDLPGLIVEGLPATNGTETEATSPWLVVIDLFRLESITPGTGDGSVFMRRYESDFPILQHVEFYTRELDTCNIRDDDSNGGSVRPELTSLGDTLSINTSSGPWFVFDQSFDDGQPVYETNNGLPGALPSDATLAVSVPDIPLINYPLVEPTPPVRLLPDNDTPVRRESVYSWLPSDLEGRMTLSLLAYDADDVFQGFKVTCQLVDDGNFTMPDDVLDFVDASTDRLEARYTRRINRLDVIDGVVFYQDSGVAE